MKHGLTQHPLAVRLGLIAVLLFILTATLVPAGTGRVQDFVACIQCGARGNSDALVNLILFAPLGAALALGGRTGFRPVCYAGLLSSGIELAQLVIPGRDPSLGDVCFNTLGAAAGQLSVHLGRRWLAAPERTAARLSIGASVFAVWMFSLTGWLLAPSIPPPPFHAWWTPDLPDLEWYRGKVLRAVLDSSPLRPGGSPLPVIESDLLRHGAALSLVVLAGPQVPALAPLLVIEDDRRRSVLLIGVDRDDLVLRYRTRAMALRLDSPDLRLRGVLARAVPGDTLQIEARRDAGGFCLALGDRRVCNLGFTIGHGWALLLYPRHFPHWLQDLLGGAWVAGLVLPIGLWTRKRPECLLAGGLLLAGVFVVPSTGLFATPPVQLIGAVGGWLLGVVLGVAYSRPPRATPGERVPLNDLAGRTGEKEHVERRTGA